jgi:hypothetical protein
MNEMPSSLDEKIQYLLLRSTVTLKLSILQVARNHLMEVSELLTQLDRDDRYYKYVFEVGFNIQKIEYWLCRLQPYPSRKVQRICEG